MHVVRLQWARLALVPSLLPWPVPGGVCHFLGELPEAVSRSWADGKHVPHAQGTLVQQQLWCALPCVWEKWLLLFTHLLLPWHWNEVVCVCLCVFVYICVCEVY